MTERSPLKPGLKERSAYGRAFEIARHRGKSARAFALLEEAHAKGDPRASYALATWYIHGKNVAVNFPKAIKLLRFAHRRGVREATYDLAYAFEAGKGVSKSFRTAFRLYVDAAQKGDLEALQAVVRCVYHGIGTNRSKDLGLLLQKLAADMPGRDRKRRLVSRQRK